VTRVRVMQKEVAIDVRGVSKRYEIYQKPADRLKQAIFRGRRNFYKEFWALKNVSLQVYKGETFGIVGRNGSGKSTLLQIIAGTLAPTTGEVIVKGKVAALLELGSGFNPNFTGRENVYLNAAILGLQREEIEKIYDQIVEFADIGDFIDQPISTYSSGMVVRLAFAVQAMVPKEVLIVDEALAVGDELFQRKCYAKIEEFKKNGGTILFVSHSGSTIIELCDRAMLIDGGEHLITGSSKRVVNLYHKLLYAPAEKQAELREKIKNECEQTDEGVESQVLFAFQERGHEIQTLSDEYDPGLANLKPIRYERDGAEISNVKITDLSGREVNILRSGQRYKISYKVDFYKKHRNVRFGMLIKTQSGFELGGAASAKAGDGIPVVTPGSEVGVEFEFTPKLSAGIYFVNAGVLAESSEGEKYIDRLIDVAAFRILHDDSHLFTAIVNFDVKCKLEHKELV